jgi:hypothetical protein
MPVCRKSGKKNGDPKYSDLPDGGFANRQAQYPVVTGIDKKET